MEAIINEQRSLNLEMRRMASSLNNPTPDQLRAVDTLIGCSELQFEEVLIAMGKDCRFSRMIDAELKLHCIKMVFGSILALPFIVVIVTVLLCL